MANKNILHALNRHRNMPLHCTCYNDTDGAEAIVRVLLEAAPDVAQVAGRYDRLPLHLASNFSNSVSVVQQLIAVHGGALHIADVHGSMPLHRACCKKTDGAEAIVRVLLEAAPECCVAVMANITRICKSSSLPPTVQEAYDCVQAAQEGTIC